VERRDLDQRIEDGRDFSAALGFGTVVVLTTDDGTAN
jgi:hypothetical protein